MACLDGNSPQARAQYALHGPGANRRQISANILTRLHGLDQYAVLSFNRHPAYFTHPDNAGQHLIGSLDPLDRAALWLSDVEGHPSADVADILGCRPDAARARISRARRKLRSLIEEEDVR